MRVWDSAALTEAQRTGASCVSCDKRWPRPHVHVGVLPDGGQVLACPECAEPLRGNTPLAAALLRGAALAINAGLAEPHDLRAAVHLAGHHTATTGCATTCVLCQAADTALTALAERIQATYLLSDTDLVDGDPERALALLRAWTDAHSPTTAAVTRELTLTAQLLEAR